MRSTFCGYRTAQFSSYDSSIVFTSYDCDCQPGCLLSWLAFVTFHSSYTQSLRQCPTACHDEKITCSTVGKGHMCTPRSKWKHQFKKVQGTFYLRQEESLTSWIPTSKNVHSLKDEFGFSWLLSYFLSSSRLFFSSRKFRVSEIQQVASFFHILQNNIQSCSMRTDGRRHKHDKSDSGFS